MKTNEPWSDKFMRNLLAKKSIIPPLSDTRMPGWYWPTLIATSLLLMCVVVYIGVIGGR